MLNTHVENADKTDFEDERQVAELRFKWIVEIEVSGTLVADGFDIKDDADLHERLAHWMPFAYGHELGGRVLKAPDGKLVRKAQGYSEEAQPTT